MQIFRDAAAALIVILLVLSVRVTVSEGEGVVQSAFAGENQRAGLSVAGPFELPALASPTDPAILEPHPAGGCSHDVLLEGDGTSRTDHCFDCGALATVNELLKQDCT
jgi:hypothetical protein